MQEDITNSLTTLLRKNGIPTGLCATLVLEKQRFTLQRSYATATLVWTEV